MTIFSNKGISKHHKTKEIISKKGSAETTDRRHCYCIAAKFYGNLCKIHQETKIVSSVTVKTR